MDCAFRVTGRLPELWDAETGYIQPAPMWRVEDGRTIVTLDFEQAGSVFVVFRQAAAAPTDPIVKMARQGDAPSPRQTPKLEIRRAIYGVFKRPDGGKVDITAELRKRVKDGRLQVPVSNDLAGDPAPDVVKELQIEYAVDGVVKSAVFSEGQELNIARGLDTKYVQPGDSPSNLRRIQTAGWRSGRCHRQIKGKGEGRTTASDGFQRTCGRSRAKYG